MLPDVGPDDNDDSQQRKLSNRKKMWKPASQGHRFPILTPHQDQGQPKIKAAKSEKPRQLHFTVANFDLDNRQNSSLKKD